MKFQATPKGLLLASLSSAILAAMALQPAVAAYDFTQPIENALKLGQEDAKYGQFKVNLRYRYEMNDTSDAGGKEKAHANTLRARIGYLTPKFSGLQGFVEYEGNLAMQQDYHGGKGNWKGDTSRDVVADPQSSELNQFWLSYKGIPDTEIKGGRQRIVMDGSRFIGNVGWRQMEQTYDAVTLTNKSIENLTIKAGYIGQIQDIFSRNIAVDAPYLNVNYKFNKNIAVSAYTYLIAYDNAATQSTKTFGFNIKGSPKLNKDFRLHYEGAYSHQSEYVNNPNRFNLNRYNLLVGASYKGITVKTGVEELGSNGTQSFQTPLGTNHKFQGWADRFLATPASGVRDVTFSVVGKVVDGTKLMFVYHNFHSPVGNTEYGNEYDFLITRKFGKHFQLLAKYAFYDADTGRNSAGHTNINKFWLQASTNF